MPTSKERTFVAIEVDPDLKRGLDTIKERDGVPLRFQVERALRGWLEENGISTGKAAKKTRKK
jgi:hypothetical protein